jgi:hypothetical protein
MSVQTQIFYSINSDPQLVESTDGKLIDTEANYTCNKFSTPLKII